jgi:hypothetical protein
MSHIVTISTKVRDPAAVAAACARLGLPAPERGTAALYSGEATGLLVRLPGWLYPAVVDTDAGVVRYDNYGGSWGEQRHLDRFLQLYAVDKCPSSQCISCYGPVPCVGFHSVGVPVLFA